MTPKQTALYWREWARVRKMNPSADRHQLHARALGRERSSKDFTNRDLDKVLAEFRAITQPDNLDVQMRLTGMSRARALYTIRAWPIRYVQSVLSDRFGGRALESLRDHEIAQLAMTLNNRGKTHAEHMHTDEPTHDDHADPELNSAVDEALGTPEGDPVAVTVDNCPF